MSRRIPAVVAGVALLTVASAAHADEAADALFKKAREALTRTKSLQADLTYTAQFGGQKNGFTATLQFMKPNLGHVTLRQSGMPGGATFISDGKNVFQVMEAEKTYQKSPAPAKGIGFLTTPSPGVPNDVLVAFFSPEHLTATPEHKAAGTKAVGGKSYKVVEVATAAPPGTKRYYFAAGGLLEGAEVEMTGARAGKQSIWLKNLKLDAPMKATLFAYTPPADFTLPKGPEGSLLDVGKPAPEFRLPMPGGSELSLTAARDGKKAVLVNFWFYG